jgi:diaminohydroxyphosphoribosylaminopyrimidine deaminase/5-amino-6-(5-phosphoribosylamino)uracil reductase
MTSHESYMAHALQLAERGLYTTDPNPRVGCVIVKDDEIVGEGWHQKAGEGHAEVNALHHAGDAAIGADCYVTLEPCSHFGRTPPCAEGLIKANVKRVFVAMMDPNPIVSGNGIKKLQQAGIEVHVGLLTEQAEQLNIGFCKRMRIGRPYVRSKIAMSLDARTAMESGESKWITGTAARQNVQKLRARSSIILTGIGTVLADNPALTVRPEGDWYPTDLDVRQPLRVVIDSQYHTPSDATILNDGFPTLIATTLAEQTHHDVTFFCSSNDDGKVNLDEVMQMLAEQGANEVMVEAGSILNGALLNAGLIDELIIYIAPKLMGNNAKGIFDLPSLNTMSEAVSLTISDIRAVGDDWRVTAIPHYKEV